jgi:Xaa-Pro aminopeptidase
MFRAAEFGEILFELRHVRAEAERAIVQRAGERSVNFLADTAELRREVEVGNSVRHFLGNYPVQKILNSGKLRGGLPLLALHIQRMAGFLR